MRYVKPSQAKTLLSPMKTTAPQQRRRISTVVEKTTFKDANSESVSGPGHVFWKLNPFEQKQYKLPEFVGFSPEKKAPNPTPMPVLSTPVVRRKSAKVSGELPADDHPDVAKRKFTVTGVEVPSQPYMKEYHSFFHEEYDHGTMSPEQAEKFKAVKVPDVYETSGQQRKNCVHVHNQVAKDVFGMDVGHIDNHLTPQGLGLKLKDLRVDKV